MYHVARFDGTDWVEMPHLETRDAVLAEWRADAMCRAGIPAMWWGF